MKTTKRIVALVMALIMCLGLLSTASAAASDVQVVEQGGTVYYDSEGNRYTSGTLGEKGLVVEMSKTVAGTEVENEFEVTLQVKTNQKLTEIATSTPDAAVLLVLDISNSMRYAHTQKKTRLQAAKEAAGTFIDQFVALEGDGRRMVAVATFGSNAQAVRLGGSQYNPDYWVDARTNAASVKSAINNLSTGGGTNIEGGLMVARNLINHGKNSASDIQGIDHIYTILLTDGNPTFHVSNKNSSTSDLSITGSKGGGDKTELEDVQDVGTMAAAIRNINNNSLSKLYSICFGTKTSDDSTIHVWDDEPFDNWSNANPATTSRMTVGQWLTAFSNAAYDAQKGTDGLFDSFNSIIELIKLAAQAWQVDDSMGDRIEYLSAVPVTNKDGNGTINNNVTVDENGDIFWNILASSVDDNITNITTNDDGTMASGVLGYTYKYKVKLDNLGDYVAGTDVLTNTEATLDYMVTDDKGEWIPELLTGTFPVPEVEGLQGSLEFTKTDDKGNALSGAEFTLALKSEGKWTSKTATSGANGKVSFTGIPSGHDFVLTESGTPEGYVSANPIDVSVSFGNTTATGFEGTASAPTVINIRKVAEVAVTKTFEGLPTELWPAVTVTLSNGTNTYSALLNADNNWTDTIEVAAPGTYTVTESAPEVEKYELTEAICTQADGKITVEIGDKKEVGFTNKYEKIVGDLTISKTNVGNTPAAVQVVITGPENYSNTVTLNAANNWTTTLEDLPVGDYYVVEAEGSANIEGYNVAVTGEGKVTVTNTAVATVALTNNYTRKVGSLTLNKTNVGNIPAEAQLLVTAPDGSTQTVTLNAANGWTTTLNNLPIGFYTVKEVAGSADIDLYNLTVSGEDEVEVTEGATASITITNTYSQKVGNLTILKTNVGNEPASVVLNVTGPNNYSNQITLNAANGWTTTLENLPIGTYTVEEVEGSADIDLYNVTVSGEGTVNVAEGETASITITNTYSQKVGNLTLNKTNVGNTPAEVKLTVTGPHDYSNEITLNAANGWTTTLNDLPIGEYTVEEVEGSADIDLYNVTVSGEGTVNVAEGETASITITNTYSQKVGNLTLNKTNVGNTPAEVKLTVTGPHDYSTEVTLNAANGWTTTLNNLPIGVYTVNEVEGSANIDLYNVTVSGEGTVNVAEGATASITITNTYSQKVGALTLNKTNVGNTPAEVKLTVTGPHDYSTEVTLNAANGWTTTLNNLPIGVYTVNEVEGSANIDLYNVAVTGEGNVTVEEGATASITITNTYSQKVGALTLNKTNVGNEPASVVLNVTGPNNYSNQITLNAANSWTQTLTNLPIGTYTVEEVEGSADIDLYNVTVTGEGNVTVEEGATASITITNTYSQKVGALTLNKTNVGNTPAEVKLRVTDFDINTRSVTLNAANGWTATIDNLPIGTYTVQEVEGSADIDLYNVTVSGEGNVTVEEGATASITITNTYTKKVGSLTLNKSNVGSTPAEVKLTVTGPYDYSNEVTLNAAGNWTATIDNLPIGIYTVTEVEGSAEVDLYNMTVSGEGDVEVTEGSTASITITNTYSQKVGHLTINKTNVGNTPEEAKFTVTGPNGYSNEVTLNAANGWTKALTNLPIGTYKVTEDKESAHVAGYTLTVAGDGEVTVAEGETATMVIKNTYTADPGKLKLVKVIEADQADPAVEYVKLQVSGNKTNGGVFTDIYTLSAENNWQTIIDIPAGVYTVEEIEQVYADEYYTVTTAWANKTVTVLPGQTTVGESNTTTCTNSYTLGNPATISIPVRKTTARGTIGNVDPYGPNVFKFKLTVADRIVPRSDKVNPGEYRVTFNGETITPVHGVYTFELTVHGRGTEEGTLVITGNPADLLNKQFIITELSRTEAGQTLNHHWTYDESSYHVYAFEGEDGYIVNIQREGDEREWDGETAEFINLYDEIIKEPPQTGDNSQLGLWMVLMVLSAACFVFTMKRRTQN